MDTNLTNVYCAACGVKAEPDTGLYFNRVSIMAKGNEAPTVTFTCHQCLQVLYNRVFPDLINIYKGESSNTIQKTNEVCSVLSKIKALCKKLL